MTNTNGTALIDTLMNTLKHLPADKQQETKIRNLCLKSLYNVRLVSLTMEAGMRL